MVTYRDLLGCGGFFVFELLSDVVCVEVHWVVDYTDGNSVVYALLVDY